MKYDIMFYLLLSFVSGKFKSKSVSTVTVSEWGSFMQFNIF